jgi:transcriptional regulator with XRE-family HTH domain
MAPSPALDQLCRGLRVALEGAGVPLGQASETLGRYPEYVGRALRQREALKVLDLFELLPLTGIHPQRFFEIYFPLVQPLAGRPNSAPPGAAELLERLQLLREPAEWSARVAELLRRHIRRCGTTQRAVARALGLPRDSLAQRLRGTSQLTWAHVFGVLENLGMRPGRFFLELVLDERDLPATLALAELLDLWEERLGRLGDGKS